MGQGHTGANDKVSSALHMFSLEVWDIEMLLRYLNEFMSFTSDLGTEVKITDVLVERQRLDLIMLTWLSTRIGRAPLQPELSDDTVRQTTLCRSTTTHCLIAQGRRS